MIWEWETKKHKAQRELAWEIERWQRKAAYDANPLGLEDEQICGNIKVISLQRVPVDIDNKILAAFFSEERAGGWKLVEWTPPKVIFIKEHAK